MNVDTYIAVSDFLDQLPFMVKEVTCPWRATIYPRMSDFDCLPALVTVLLSPLDLKYVVQAGYFWGKKEWSLFLRNFVCCN